MDPDLLPRVGVISNTSIDLLRLFSPYSSIAEQSVLCVGYTEPELMELVEPYRPSAIVCLTNWLDHPDAQVSRHRLVVGDLCQRTAFPDGEFDTVLLFSVLEHLHDVDGAFLELRRILKPRGYVALIFGPAWSCAYGHHLFADPNDGNLNFARWELPAHMHLLCDPEEIREWYRQRNYEAAVGDSVLHWFYETPIINRVFYEDYLRLMARYFQIVACETMYNDLPGAHRALLRDRFPGYLDFSSYGGKFLLKAA
jgi:SAM-dependent methyltransferase